MTRRNSFASFVFVSVLGSSSAAFAQPTPAAQPAAPALPDVRGVAAVCGALPPSDRPIPALTGDGVTLYRRALITGNAEFAAGHFAAALPWRWEAFRLNPTAENLDALIVTLNALGPTSVAQRCAIIACVAPRATVGAQHDAIEPLRLQCDTETVPAPTAVQRFTLTGDALLAVRADAALLAEIQRDHATDASHADRWEVPVTFRARVDGALVIYRRNHPIVVAVPQPSRSPFGYAAPISLAVAGVALGVAAISQTVRFGSATARLDDANNGRTQTGWPRDAETEAGDARTAQFVLYPAAAACLAGAVVTWVVLGPHAPVTLAPNLGPQHAGLSLSYSF